MDKSILFGMIVAVGIMIFLTAIAFSIVVFILNYVQPDFLCELCKSNCTNLEIILP